MTRIVTQATVTTRLSRPVASRSRVVDYVAENNLLVVLILLLAAVLFAVGRSLFVQDSWLTLVSGREIAQHGLPHHEALTTIAAGRVWTDQQWLGQLAFYGLDRAGGLGLVVVFHGLLVSSALAITVVVSRLRGASARMTLIGALFCIFVAPWSWQLRAQSLALPLFALTLGLVATDQSLRARRTLLVFPILALWANVHGSVILGAALVSLAGLLRLASRLLDRHNRRQPVWQPLVYLVAPWACVLVSPYGTDLVAYYRLLLFASPVSRYVQEWRPPHPQGYVVVFFAAAAATVVVAVWQRRRLSLFDLLVLAITLAGALRSGRGILWFSIAAAMLLPLALDGLVHKRPSPPVHRRLGLILAGALGALAVIAGVAALVRSDSWYERAWPAPLASKAARATAAAGPNAAVWPSDRYADWLLWKEPSLRGHVAWDVRFELLTGDEMRSILRFKQSQPGWRNVVAPYEVLVLDRDNARRQARILAREGKAQIVASRDGVLLLVRPER